MRLNIICVDKSPCALSGLIHQIRCLMPGAAVHGCRSPDEAIGYAEAEGCDVLLTDTDLARAHTDGFMLAERIQAINPRVNIIFITEQTDGKYACAAYRLHASGYLTKPFDPEELDAEFANLRFAAG